MALRFNVSSATTVHAFQVRPEYKHFIGLQLRYPLRREIRALNSIVRSHIVYEGTKNPAKNQ